MIFVSKHKNDNENRIKIKSNQKIVPPNIIDKNNN